MIGPTMVRDPRLTPLIESGGAEAEIERLLVEVAAPLMRKIVTRYGAGCLSADVADLESMITLRLLHKLRRIAASTAEEIADLERYVATVSYNVVNDYLRRRFPERTRHKNRLRYVLTHDPRLALWSASMGPAGGLKEWEGSATAATTVTLASEQVTRTMRDKERPADALHALFGAFGGPVVLEALVDQTAALWDVPLAPAEIPVAPQYDAVPLQMERRDMLRALWREIEQLPPMQRKALLLNLRGEETVNVVALVVLTGTARFDQVAAALEMTAEQLSDIWNDLPLDDLRIAALVNVTRQQVINLRKSARERLQRRLGHNRPVGTS
jgi:DNA-directed RNA polymerase specialized sigma24 family protein